jgi:putative FmdB family regulatory protein
MPEFGRVASWLIFTCEVIYMPFYEYECTKCNHHTEVFQRISDKPITKCEKCKGRMKKLISQSAFHLKGSGWYVTDYASKSGGYDGKKSSVEKTGGDDTAAGSSIEAKSDSSPAKETSGSSSEGTKKKAKSKD